MRRLSRGAMFAAVLLVGNGGACRGQPADPPYAPDQGPVAPQLLELTRPPLRALSVPDAKIRQGRSPAGALMLAAQASPPRFAGSITAAGNELVSIAVNEDGYGLRWLRDDGLRSGFYTGPPSACAIERVLGVALSTEDLVALLLGGGPLIPDARIVAQRWEGERLRRREHGHPGHEVVSVENEREAQDLLFAWFEGRWWFAGTTLWRREGDARRWLWTVEHHGLRRVGEHVLPARTSIRRPGGRGEIAIEISYLEQRPDPAALVAGGTSGGEEGGDTWEDDWEDEAGADEGEQAPAAPAPDVAREPSLAAPANPIPAVFVLDAAGLSPQGDLCRPG